MLLGLRDGHRVAQRIAFTHEDAQLQLNVEPLARAHHGHFGAGGHGLPLGAMKRLARHTNAGCAAVVANRHPFVVGQQRVVGAELLADVGGVVHRGVEVGVVANAGGHVVLGLGLGQQAALQRHLLRTALAQRARQGQAQGAPGGFAQSHQGIELVLRARLRSRGRYAREGAAGRCGGQIQNLVANGYAAAEGITAALAAEHRKRQVLQRKVVASSIGAGHPAAQAGVMGFVQQVHGVLRCGCLTAPCCRRASMQRGEGRGGFRSTPAAWPTSPRRAWRTSRVCPHQRPVPGGGRWGRRSRCS